MIVCRPFFVVIYYNLALIDVNKVFFCTRIIVTELCSRYKNNKCYITCY